MGRGIVPTSITIFIRLVLAGTLHFVPYKYAATNTTSTLKAVSNEYFFDATGASAMLHMHVCVIQGRLLF